MWDKEADVIIVGFGGAGASSAITAHDLGVKVIILEKDKRGGGNTRLAGGTIREYLDIDKAVKYFDAILTDVSPEMKYAFVEEGAKNADWMISL